MATDLDNAIRHFHRVERLRDADSRSDEELLDCFVARQDPAAFEALVHRHGPMVLGVCRRLLRHSQDAEDAFQAVFLVLVKKAGAIAHRELLGNWLYGVAYRTASRARIVASQRRARERQVIDMPGEQEAPAAGDVLKLLDQELSRLPEKYRTPVVLCDLQGEPRAEVARRLACPLGTVSSRLSRGREMLRERLARRGVALSAPALAAVLAEGASAAVPAPLAAHTVEVGLLYAADAGAVTAPVAALTVGVLKTMFLSRLKIALAGLLILTVTVAATGAGTELFLRQSPAAEKPPVRSEDKPKAVEEKEPSAEELRKQVLSPGLLRQERVQKELKLSDNQLDRLKKIHEEAQEKFKGDLDKLREEARDLDRLADVQRKLYQIRSQMVLVEHARLIKVLPEMLKDEQLKRLKELSLQESGLGAFHLAEVAKGLKLTAEQKKKIAAIHDKAIQEANKSMRSGSGVGGYIAFDEKAVRTHEKIWDAALKEVVVDVLTAEQEKAWKEMIGKPFDLKWNPTKPASKRGSSR
jgi:RNA polymerase sigma factor (sigma-70 family)